MKSIVVYHKADFDGIFCLQIAKRRFGQKAEYIGWDYGDPVPDVPLDTALYLLDISVDGLMGHPLLTWIDHHKSAIEKYGERKGVQMDGVAACRLAWAWLFPDKERDDFPTKEEFTNREVSEPLAVRLAGEYDVWDKRDERAELFQLGLKAKSLNEKYWDAILTPGLMSESVVLGLVDDGRTIGRYKAALDADIMAACGFELEFEGLNFLALNTARCNSDTFKSAVKPHHDGLLAFRFDGGKWTVSLYGTPHKPDIDLSRIAVKYGGGGHKQACGFQTKALPFSND